MAKSERQKSLQKKMIIFGVLSYFILFALVMFYAISAGMMFDTETVAETSEEGIQIFTDEVKLSVIATSTTAIIGIIASFFLKEGMRTFVWIACVVLGSLIYKETGMYVSLGCWLIDEYVIHNIFRYYRAKYEIRKEIDHD